MSHVEKFIANMHHAGAMRGEPPEQLNTVAEIIRDFARKDAEIEIAMMRQGYEYAMKHQAEAFAEHLGKLLVELQALKK